MLAGLALIGVTPAWASQEAAPAPTVSGVTVTPPKQPNALVDPTTQFVREHLPESAFSEQFPRFRDAICVRVVGLPREFDEFTARRIRDVASAVHAPIAKSAVCRPNVDVIFTGEPQALLADIAKRKDILLGFYFSQAQLKRLSTFSRPVEARYVTRTRDDSGKSKLEIHDPMAWTDPPVGRAGSRLSNGMSAEVVHTLIITDANKVADAEIGAVADYVAVLALARWRGLERCNTVRTILNLMAEGCADEAPHAATAEDLALLKRLYSVDPRETGSQQRGEIASQMRKAAALKGP